MPVAVARLLVDIKSLRHHQCLLIHGTCHAHVEEPAFFLDLGGASGGHVARNAAIDNIEKENRAPFPALGGMKRVREA